ncbi:hypothetical protein IW492_11360 [Enterococcus sp. BWB1-3]|nr:hypothetical protein [Enterococcus sp. BWB1-3]
MYTGIYLSVKAGSINDLSDNAKNILGKYENGNWSGNVSGQTQGTAAGARYYNTDGQLPDTDMEGNKVIYKEFDVNNRVQGMNRDAERFVRGSDGSLYYTTDHYKTFTKIK